MPIPTAGAIDCDVHVSLPATRALLPYFDDYWRDHITIRGLERDNLEITAYPPGSPLSGRPDWRPAQGPPGSDRDLLLREGLDRFGSRIAILNCLHGGQVFFAEDLSAAFCRAINDWIAAEWLDLDPRLRASIVIPAHSAELSVQEIERLASDRRFVQVLMMVMGELPPGRRQHWPIYQAAERHGLPIGLHAGSSFRHPPTMLGWPSYYLEDYIVQASGFAGALNSLITEGVFVQFPRLKVVLLESGVTWLPNYLWRATKTWRAARIEVPWNKRSPAEDVRAHVRLTIQPFDAPPDTAMTARILDEIGSDDLLLFSTDFPHWHFDGCEAMPDGIPQALWEKILVGNALATYPRLNPETER